jgi:predicted SnoaL-like aldol condensation-catalyzing enzyme
MKREILTRLAQELTARRPIDVEQYFTPDFRLHDPNAPHIAKGLSGARETIAGILSFAPDMTIEVIDTLEERDRIAVRWRLTGTREGKGTEAAIVAIYRFAGPRIAEDWGIGARAPWP